MKVPSDTGLCNAAGRLFHNVPILNWTARRPYDEATEKNVTTMDYVVRCKIICKYFWQCLLMVVKLYVQILSICIKYNLVTGKVLYVLYNSSVLVHKSLLWRILNSLLFSLHNLSRCDILALPYISIPYRIWGCTNAK